MSRVSTSYHSRLQEQLVEISSWYAAYDDHISTGEIEDLVEKLSGEQLTLSFCGHFSAGKSSLINTLCGREVLLSGPMPTTANIAKLRNGKPRILVTPSNHSEKITASIEQMDEYCQNGTAFSEIEIWDEIPILGECGVLLDTPGVDSGDAAHALATNSALHLADVVFYVMDYNHVLSESNLTFAKKLADWGKPMYLIINQIDKHREEELAFERYKESVEAAFEMWGIHTAGIFYISIKNQQHPLSMLGHLKDTITKLLQQRDALLEHSIACSLQHGAEQFLARRDAAVAEEYENSVREAGGEDNLDLVHNELQAMQLEYADDGDQVEAVRKQFISELDSILGSVQLMNPGLREAARLYLESRQPGFKMGLLFNKGKTEREQEGRVRDFLDKLKEQTLAQLDWHVRELLRQMGKTQHIWSSDWENMLDTELPQCEASWITGPAREGAVVSGEYTLRYCADVAAEIGGRYRRAALTVTDRLLEALAPRFAEAQANLATGRAALMARTAAAERAHALRTAARERAAQLHALLGAGTSLPPGILPEVRDAPALPPRQRPAALAPQAPAPAAAGVTAARGAVAPVVRGRGRLTEAAALLEAAAAELVPYPSFGSGVRELQRRALRLRDGSYTIALFGAFSAGKSSFANALLGAQVLPVSPHPTTAAINRILAPADGMSHGQAVITFKTIEAMQADLAYSFESLQLGIWKQRSWQQEVGKIRAADIPPSGRAHYSFLKAATAGWEHHAPQLGKKKVISLDDFAPYVSEESIACFVENVDLYYSCPLTEQGIIIVDTPGADSIHARHTGVTFQYMKNCDALLYVTYYNHAFSRADRQFLAHLGRVKGSFALDKMFFLVNAADLASSPQELNDVVEHVKDGLRGAGIESPQLYAISSHAALKAKHSDDLEMLVASGFSSFEDNFLQFIDKELVGLAINASASELKKWMDRAIQRHTLIQQSQDDQIRQQQQLHMDRNKLMDMLKGLAKIEKKPEIDQEIDELLFHVRRRLILLANDLFHEYFHPVLLQETGGDMKRKFISTFRGFLVQLSIELSREIQATSLRVEKKCQHMLTVECTDWISRLDQELDMVPVFAVDFSSAWDTPEIGDRMLDHSLEANDYMSYFKNPKMFFEGGGKQRLREALEGPLEAKVREVVQQSAEMLYDYYHQETSQRFASIANQLQTDWNEWESGINSLSHDLENKDQLKRTTEQLEKLYEAVHKNIY